MILRKLFVLCFFLINSFSGICQKSPCTIRIFFPKDYPFQEASLYVYEKSTKPDSLVFNHRLSLPQSNYTFDPKKTYSISVTTPYLTSNSIHFKADTLRCPLIINLKPIEKTLDLQEVTVKVQRERFERQGDTLLIHVKDSDARPHAESSTLFDRIQGLESSSGGNLRVLGKSVQEVTVDGKKIFGGVGSLTLDNIKADMIERMEFIESSPNSSQSQNTLNLVLKPNKKKGVYGNLSAGYGNNQNYTAQSRISKIMPKGFVSAFATSNTLNERGIDPKTLEEMTVRNYKKSLNRQGSPIGLYENDLTQNTENQTNIHQALQGINRYADFGFNVTRITSKIELDGFIMGIGNQNSLLKRQTSFSIFNSVSQTLESMKTSNEQLNHIHAQANLTWKINPKTTFQLSHQTQLSRNHINQTDSIQSFIERFNSIRTSHRQLNQDNTLSDNIVQMSIVQKAKKQGVVSSLYTQTHYFFPDENKLFNITISSLVENKNTQQVLLKENQIRYSSTQFLHARPLSKRLLFEGKLKYTNQNVKLWQQNTSIPNQGANSFNNQLNQEFVSKVESGVYIFYKRPTYQVISGLGYWKWLIRRETETAQFTDSPHFWLNPFTKINFRLANNSLSIKFAREPYLPTWKSSLALIDSSEVFNLVRGNERLSQFRQNTTDIMLSSSTKNGYQLNLSVNYQFIEQGIINQNIFNPQMGAFESTFSNAKEPTSIFAANVTLFRIRLNSRFTWFFLGGIVGLNSFMETQNQLTPLSTRFGYTQFSSTLKLNSNIQIRANIKSQFTYLASRFQSNHQLTIRNNIDLGKKWYFDSHLRFNANVTNQLQVQSFIDTEISKYFLRNNQCKASFQIKNLFNTPFERTISQAQNTQTIQEINHLPFTSVLSFTFYPEKWK